MKTKFIFVRHGEALGNIERIFHGFTNSALTERGRQQIKRVGQHLATESIDYIYSSDLTRAYETALAIAKHHHLPVEIDSRFREINGGEWENVAWDRLPVLFADSYQAWIEKPHALKLPSGETMTAFFDRLRTGTEELLQKHAGKTICVATHGTAVRVLCCYLKGKPLTELNDIIWCDNAAITVAEHDGTCFRVIKDGDNSYLTDISTINEQEWWKN